MKTHPSELTINDFDSEAGIRACGLLSGDAFHLGRLLDAWRAAYPPPPPAAPPKPALTVDQRIQLPQINAAVVAAKDNLLSLDRSVAEYRERLPDLQANLVEMQRATHPDAPEAVLLRIATARIRVEIMTEFIASAPARRELLLRQQMANFARLNHALEGVTGERFFLSGSRPELNSDAAISAIAKLLEK